MVKNKRVIINYMKSVIKLKFEFDLKLRLIKILKQNVSSIRFVSHA